MTMPVTCPYCNALVTVPSGKVIGAMVSCGRCGESFPLLSEQANVVAVINVAPVPSQNLAQPGARSNRLVGAIVLGVMGLMASVGMVYALYTAQGRRAYDKAEHQRPAQTWVDVPTGEDNRKPVAPAQLAALGYLPAKTNLVLGIDMEELARSPEAQKLLQQSFPMGNSSFRPDQVAGWLGLKPEAIDHLVLGISTKDSLLPSGVLIVRTRDSLTEKQIQSQLKGERVPGIPRRHLYRLRLENVSFQPVILWINEHTQALAIIPAHLEGVPDEPRQGLGHLSTELSKLIVERVEPGCTIWVVGELNEQFWMYLGNLGRWEPPLLQRVQPLREFAVGMRTQQPFRIGVALHMNDEKAAASWEEGWKDQKMLNLSRDGQWIRVQLDSDHDFQKLIPGWKLGR
jgi:hypothetical protein